MSAQFIALLTLLTPLASAAIIAIFLRRQGTLAALVSTLAALIVAGGALTLAFSGQRFGDQAATGFGMEWFRFGHFTLSMGFLYNDLAALMLSIVGVVGLCVHIFSWGYMRDDGAKARYFGGLSIFMFSMNGIVLADNLFMIFVFWEVVGFSSWLLIGHFCTKLSAAEAAKKSFITNRVGDFAFLLGIIFCLYSFGTTNLAELAQASAAGATVSVAVPLLLFCGAVGKSAQMPLHVWLPDAMEGPTPVSALIHAATMVAAGIFMLCRAEPVFAIAPALALQTVLWVGTLTALYAALCAIVQNDIKKVLAYSTLSQLGYMVAAFGLGSLEQVDGGTKSAILITAGVGAAMFHLTTHAFFKALLFLGSGSIIHGCHHEQDILKMGGLSRRMPITFLTFTIGVLAISGLPFLSGFFSKDAILYLAMEKNTPVFVILALTAALTAFYMFRMWKLTFFGEARSEDAEKAHEVGASMLIPLLVLAGLAVVGGYGALYGPYFDGVLSQVPHPHGADHTRILLVSVIVLLAGGGGSLLFYRAGPADTLKQRLPRLACGLRGLNRSFDSAYGYYIAKVQQRFALLLNFVDQILIAGVIVRGVASVVGLFGLAARALHVGNLHIYVYWFLAGAAILWALAVGVF